MSDTVKLIIEIPKAEYEEVGHLIADGIFDYNGVIATVCKAITNGTPLDDVKAEIEYNAEIHEDGECYLMEQWVYDVLDGKYRAESEE